MNGHLRRVFNRLEPHLGCYECRGVLDNGRCLSCDPRPVNEHSDITERGDDQLTIVRYDEFVAMRAEIELLRVQFNEARSERDAHVDARTQMWVALANIRDTCGEGSFFHRQAVAAIGDAEDPDHPVMKAVEGRRRLAANVESARAEVERLRAALTALVGSWSDLQEAEFDYQGVEANRAFDAAMTAAAALVAPTPEPHPPVISVPDGELNGQPRYGTPEPATCARCKGVGIDSGEWTGTGYLVIDCPACGGSGTAPQQETPAAAVPCPEETQRLGAAEDSEPHEQAHHE